MNESLLSLVTDPPETLSVELKSWIDPRSPDGIAKIAKACIAMWNHNGGHIVIGVNDDRTRDIKRAPTNPRELFHSDVVQGIVSKYSSHPIPIDVEFVSHEGIDYPVIAVPTGVRSPAACRATVHGSDALKLDAVYVRTLKSNHSVSTSVAKCDDWPRLVETCFNNREADIGAFLRRQLSSSDIRTAMSIFQPPPPTVLERAIQTLNGGYPRAIAAAAEHGQAMALEEMGVSEFAVSFDGEFTSPTLDADFIERLGAAIPRLTGWPPFLVAPTGSEWRPYIRDGAWESFIWSRFPSPDIDFWRISPSGDCYALRVFSDDLSNSSPARDRTIFDFYLPVTRTVELLACALVIGRTLGLNPETATLGVAAKWRKLSGRRLVSWVNPRLAVSGRAVSRTDTIESSTTLPLATPPDALAPHVRALVAPLLSAFDLTTLSAADYEGYVRERVNRRV